jgi:hypothetical protein
VRQLVEERLRPEWQFRSRWREAEGTRDFDDLDAWLAHAASAAGNGASVSQNLTVEELEDLGPTVADLLRDMAGAFAPLVSYAYADSRESALVRALSEYEVEVDAEEVERTRTSLELGRSRFEDLFGSPDKVAELSAEDFFEFLYSIDERMSSSTGLYTLGQGLPTPRDPTLPTWRALEEDLPQLKQAITSVLYDEPEDDLSARIDTMLAGPKPRRYITRDLALATILLTFADPGSYSGVQRMGRKFDLLEAMGILPDLPEDATDGQRFVAYERALMEMPAAHGKDWDWAMRYRFFWSEAFKRNLSPGTAADESESAPESTRETGLDGLASDLYLNAAFLQQIKEMLKEKKQVIFFGPPGTGKTWVAQKLIEWLAPMPEQREVVQFHPSYSYEDFVLARVPQLRRISR